MKKAFGATLAAVVAALAFTTVALADGDEVEVKGGKGEVTVIAKGEWHVNKDFPWKVTAGDKTFDKSKFTFTEKQAKVGGVPAGQVHVRGAICSGPQCKPFDKDVTVSN